MAKKTNSKNEGSGQKQVFTFSAPGAGSVQLVGDFTHWQENPIQMRRDPQGIWRASVQLQPGLHHYRFMVDGEWRDDPECSVRVPNPFGTQNSVRQVG